MSQDIHQIQCVVADASGLTVLDLRSARRSQPLARMRQVAMWLCRRLTLHSLPEIGRAFGDRDHTTVMHAIAVTEQRMAADARFSGQVMGIAERIDLEQTEAVRRAMA